MIAALLLGREGSAGFPGKNTSPVLGRPMMAYSLLAAQHARSENEVYVSTDSPRIREIAKEYGASLVERPPELCTATTLGEDAYVYGYRPIRHLLQTEVGLLVVLFSTGYK